MDIPKRKPFLAQRERAAADLTREVFAFSAFPLILFLCLWTAFVPFALGQGEEIDSGRFFETRIRPLLANSCFACHTDQETSGLRVDSREALLKGGDSGPAIVPGDAEGSLLLLAVSHTHEHLKMPLGGKLADQEIEDLRTWVRMGAPWPSDVPTRTTEGPESAITEEEKSFWAFQPLHKPSLPKVRNKTWPKSAMDSFILSKLEAGGFQPVEAAEKRRLIRRLSFDLIGLPPTPSEVEAFLQDSSPTAVARVVDRLLASPHFGERWARYWLDVARYAENDKKGPYPNAWRYRDWVVEAFNQDMPYDLFVKAQIAGDLMENSQNLVAGLGFFVLGPWYYNQPTPAKARAQELEDRVDTLTRGFLGLTGACARCHDHKYDPISRQDYYSLAGIFKNSPYQEYPLVSEDVVQEYKQQEEKVKGVEKEIEEFEGTMKEQLTEIFVRRTSRYMVAAWKVLGVPKLQLEKVAEEEKLDEKILDKWVKYLGNREKRHPYLGEWFELLDNGTTVEQARKLADDFQAFVLSIIEEKKAIAEENQALVAQAKCKSLKPTRTRLPNGFVDDIGDLVSADLCAQREIVTKSLKRDEFILWINLFQKGEGSGDPFNDKFSGVLVFEDKEMEPFLTGEWKSHLLELRAELETLKKALPEPYPYLHGFEEAENPADMRMHLRGNPSSLGEEVPRRFLAVLSRGEATPFRKGSGRLELAEAVARHPLTARVMVNRIWKQLFGYGIVRTLDNLGRAGERPTHPELLDYLAFRFTENNRSIKAMIREIVLSASYQLSSSYSEKNFAQDPDNRLLWRANRRRLDAEALRDSLLFVSGGLDDTVGGPSAELEVDHKRRTLYGKINRGAPSGPSDKKKGLNKMLTLFDFPSPGKSSAQRVITNVPLQRLFFLNSDTMMVQAPRLADRLERELGADDRGKIGRAYELLFGREASEEEMRLGLGFLQKVSTSSEGKPSAWQRYAQVLLSSNEFNFVD